jgi:hypothetical protein
MKMLFIVVFKLFKLLNLHYLYPDSAMDISKTFFITSVFCTIFLCFLCKKAETARECEGIMDPATAAAKKRELLKTQGRMIVEHSEKTILYELILFKCNSCCIKGKRAIN